MCQGRLPYPNDILDQSVAATSPEHAQSVQAWHSARTVWPLVDLLAGVATGTDDRFALLRQHLTTRQDTPTGRRYALGRRIATLFADYGASRPELTRHPFQVEQQSEGQESYWRSFWEGEWPFYGHVPGFKGLERPAVVLAINGFRDGARAKEMLYVGLSRARDLLVVCGDIDIDPTDRRGRRRETTYAKLSVAHSRHRPTAPCDTIAYPDQQTGTSR